MSDLPEKYLELMHADIDREASEQELADLREYVAAHPEAQSHHAELVKLTNILNQAQELEPPADLRKNIMAALPRRRSVIEIGLWKDRSRFRIPLIRYGYAVAAGVLLGAVLTGIALKNLSPEEEPHLYGTMTSVEGAQRFTLTEQIKVAAPDVGGTVKVSRSGDNERVVFDLDSSRPVEIEMSFDGSRAGLKGFSQEPTRVHSFEAKEGSISFRSESKQSSTVILAGEQRPQLPVKLRFYVEGKLAYEATIGIAGTQ